MSDTKPKIIVFGTHGQQNLGDELLLQAFIKNFKTKFRILTNSYTPEITSKEYGIETFDTQKDIWKLPFLILGCRAIVFDGGNIIKELNPRYGGSRYIVLLKLIAICIYSRICFKKVILSNIGIGPVESKFGIFLAKAILQIASKTTVRDQNSLLIAKNLGFELELIPDAAFTFSKESLDISDSETQKINNKKIAINICRNIENPDNWDNFENRLIETILEISKNEPKIEYVGISMQTGFALNDDLKALEAIQNKINQKNPAIIFTLYSPKNLKELTNLLFDVEIVMSCRLHLTIISTILAKPFIAFEYDIKVGGFLKNYNLQKLGVNISNPSKDSFIENYLDIKQSYEQISLNLAQISEQNNSVLDHYFTKLIQQINH